MNIYIKENHGSVNEYNNCSIVNNYYSEPKEACKRTTEKSEAVDTPYEVVPSVSAQTEKPKATFFKVSSYRTYEDCMGYFMRVIQSTSVKKKILEGLLGEEGRKWFTLHEMTAKEIENTLKQYPCKATITEYDIKNVLKGVREEMDAEKRISTKKYKNEVASSLGEM